MVVQRLLLSNPKNEILYMRSNNRVFSCGYKTDYFILKWCTS